MPTWTFDILLPDTVTPAASPITQAGDQLIGQGKHDNQTPKRRLRDLKLRYYTNYNCFATEFPIKTVV